MTAGALFPAWAFDCPRICKTVFTRDEDPMRKTPGVFTIRSSVEDTLAARRLSCVNATTETGTDWRRSSVRRAVTTMSSKQEFKGACFTSTVDGSRLDAAAAVCAADCDGQAINAIPAIDKTESPG